MPVLTAFAGLSLRRRKGVKYPSPSGLGREEFDIVSQGTCDERFAGVRAAFEKNLDQDDVGASVAVTVDGDFVVDLWGGYRDAARTQPWLEDTIVNVFSSTKTMMALAALVAADRGELVSRQSSVEIRAAIEGARIQGKRTRLATVRSRGVGRLPFGGPFVRVWHERCEGPFFGPRSPILGTV